jgi:adenylate kinase
MLRDAVQDGSALGRRVRPFLESGQLVPDELMEELIVERLGRQDAKQGFILDGFPRTADQVVTLDRVLGRLGATLDRAFVLSVPEAELVRRLSGRRVCPGCGALYHIESRPPASAGICDKCGSALVQRPDDQEDVVKHRLEVYRNQTLPVIRAYSDRSLHVEVDGTGDPDAVYQRIDRGLAAV